MTATIADPQNIVYVARQPVLDQNSRVFGYELLYRSAGTDTTCTASPALASPRVFTAAVLSLGLDTLTHGRPAFINLTRSMLTDNVSTLLPASAAVFELHEAIEVDAEVIETCRRLYAGGYKLALDDFVPDSDAERLLPYATYVKLDVLSMSAHVLRVQAKRLLRHGVRLVAEKVETAEMFQQMRDAGYTFFQGYFFCRPKTSAASTIPSQRLTYVRLLAALNKPTLTVRELEQIVKRDAALSYRVLRCINSAAYGLRQEVKSIERALVLLGQEPIRRWASIWCMAALNVGGTPELVTTAVVRARCCELLAQWLTEVDPSELFIVGLCSLLDALLRRPMAEALADLPLSQTAREALLGQQNTARAVLETTMAYERGAWEEAVRAARRVGISEAQLPIAYNGALHWARELSTTVAAG